MYVCMYVCMYILNFSLFDNVAIFCSVRLDFSLNNFISRTLSFNFFYWFIKIQRFETDLNWNKPESRWDHPVVQRRSLVNHELVSA